MNTNYYEVGKVWMKELYSDYRERVNLFGLFFLLASTSFAIGYLSVSEFNRTPIVIEACSVFSSEAVDGKKINTNVETKVLGSSMVKEDYFELVVKDAEPIFIEEKNKEKVLSAIWCDFNTDKTATQKTVIFNEVAWMGSNYSPNDEWMEIRNIAPIGINLKDWQIQDKKGQIKLVLPNKILEPGRLLVLARQEERLGLWADLIYSGVLSNSNEEIKLFDSSCSVADFVRADKKWLAGENKEKKTMERSDDLSWHTYNGSGQIDSGVGTMGTPGRENTSPPEEKYIEKIFNQQVVDNNSQEQIYATEAANEERAPEKLLINCVQITGGPGRSKEDRIEIYNPNIEAVNLEKYRLVKRTKTGVKDSSIKSWTKEEWISPEGFYVWANSSFKDSGGDTTTGATISRDNGIALRFGPINTGEVIDRVAWGKAENDFIEEEVFAVNPEGGQKICRKNFQDGGNNAMDFEVLGTGN